jgi:hypothetical protein
VLLGILGGLTNRRIGENIGVSESAVKSVVQQLFQKARVRKRGQLVRVALEGSLSAARELAERARNALPAVGPEGSHEPAQPTAPKSLPGRPSRGS